MNTKKECYNPRKYYYFNHD